MAAPLTDLVRKGEKKLKWIPGAFRTFEDLKQCFCSAPILKQPDPQLLFHMEVNASEVGIRAVLAQKDPLTS